MKTKLFLLILSLVSICGIRAQGIESLDINNINAGFLPGHVFFNADSPYNKRYEVPKGSGINSIFSSSLWLTGLGPGSQLRGFGGLYGQVLYPGPIATNYNAAYDSTYHKVWKVTRAEVADHISHVGTAGYLVPPHIAAWPGNGNTANGEAHSLAPFIDVDHNGIYEPALGDYPDFCGDEAIFILLNDAAPGAGGIGCDPMGAEVHVLVYAFASADTALNNAIFMNVQVFNRSSTDYTNVRFSNFTDPDVGCSQNDRFGCDTVLNSFFAYNQPGAPDGGASCLTGESGYGTTKVAQGVTFLDRKLIATETFNNATGDMGDPGTCEQMRNYQSGLWKDGTPLTRYGNGLRNDTFRVSFIYPGEPADSTAWSELHPLFPISIPAGDRRGVGTVYIDTLPRGGSFSADMVYITSFADAAAPDLAEIAKLKQDIRHIRSLYDQGLVCTASLQTGIRDVTEDAVTIAPNPAKDMIMIKVGDAYRTASSTLTDMMGKVIMQSPLIGSSTTISIGDLASGMYLLHIGGKTYKVVKE